MDSLQRLQVWALVSNEGVTEGSERILGWVPIEKENKGMVELKGDGGRGDNGGRS